MATREQLIQALAKADAAGEYDDAALFADEIKKLDAAPARDAKAEYDAMGPLQQAGTAAADTLRSMSNGATFGLRDKMGAGIRSLLPESLGGQEYEPALARERQLSADTEARAGGASTAAELAGGMVTGGALAKGGMTLMEQVPTQGLNLLKRMGMMGGAGAAEGGVAGMLNAYGDDTSVPEGAASGMAMGAIGGAGAEGLGSLLNKIMGRGMGNAAPAPTMDELLAQEQTARDALKSANYQIPAGDVARLNQDIRANLTEAVDGPRPQRHPAALAEINKLAEYTPSLKDPVVKANNTVRESASDSFTTTQRNNNPPVMNSVRKTGLTDATTRTTKTDAMPDRGLSLYDLDLHRQATSKNVAQHADKAESGQGTRLISEIDKFTDRTIPPAQMGDLREARRTGHKVRKLEEVGQIVRSAERKAEAVEGDATGSQLRNKLAAVLDSAKKTRGYSPEEIQMMEDIVGGTFKGNMARKGARLAGNLPGYVVGAGLGGGLGTLVGGPAGGTAGGVMGVMASAGAKKALSGVASRETDRQADELLDTIARGHKKPPRNKPQIVSQGDKSALARFLALLGLENQDRE